MLFRSADKVANTASVYASFLKHVKRTAQKELVVEPALFEESNQSHQVYNEDANKLIKKIEGDILYLDPPYNARQYGNYYHILNTIAEYKPIKVRGVTGMRDYKRSTYCQKHSVLKSFDNLIKNARFKYIFLSYNNEGLVSLNEIRSVMEQYGKYEYASKNYQRFKSDRDANRTHKAEKTKEFLHILTK